MNQHLTEIHLKNSEDDYYIGYVINKNSEITTMICLDDDGNEGGVQIFQNNTIGQSLTDSDNITFYQYLIDRGMSKDPFKLSEQNQEILKQHFNTLSDALVFALKLNHIISLDTLDGYSYRGLLTAVNEQKIRIKEESSNLDLEAYDTVIPIEQICSLDFNAADTNFFDDWLHEENQEQNDLNLVEIYLNYKTDARYGSYVCGKIVAQTNHHRILFERYNDVGQIEAMTLINYDHILHISKHSRELDYLAYQIKRNNKAGIRDPYGLIDMIHMSGSIFDLDHLPTIERVLQWEQESKNLIDVDDVDFDSSNMGVITSHDEQQFKQKVVDGYHFSSEENYHLKNIVAIDLFSNELLQMQLFMDEKK